MFTPKQVELIQKAAIVSGTIIANDRLLIRTQFGNKKDIGLSNIFLHQLELLTNTHPGTFQISPSDPTFGD